MMFKNSKKMKNPTEHYTNLIVLLQSFEKLWYFYLASDGQLYNKETKESGLKLVKYFATVYKIDPSIYNSTKLGIDKNNNEEYVKSTLVRIKKWALSDSIYLPLLDNEINYPPLHNELSRYILHAFFMCINSYLCRKLKLKIFPTLISGSGESEYTRNEIRWKGHFPNRIIDKIDKSFVEKLSNSDTIVVIADIRKSQDIMTYGPNPEFFRDKILEYMQNIRKIIKDNFGIFDKFTGDGFLCYFNSYMCDKYNRNYYEQFHKACLEIMKYSEPFFNEWIKHIRKIPPNSTGITIGVDSGLVKFLDLENHLFAIGDAIVWANRMGSSGRKGEVVLNNLPYQKMINKFPKLTFREFESQTKGGESFIAYKYNWDDSKK